MSDKLELYEVYLISGPTEDKPDGYVTFDSYQVAHNQEEALAKSGVRKWLAYERDGSVRADPIGHYGSLLSWPHLSRLRDATLDELIRTWQTKNASGPIMVGGFECVVEGPDTYY